MHEAQLASSHNLHSGLAGCVDSECELCFKVSSKQ